MSFYFSRFGNDAELILPRGSVANSMGSFSTAPTEMQTVGRGGLYDLYGLDDAPSGATAFTLRGTLLNATNHQGELEEDYRRLLGYRGKVRRLFRTWPASGLSEWAYARLTQVDATRDSQFHRVIQGLTLTFEMRSTHWNGRRHGAGWEFDSGQYLDSGLNFDEASADNFTLPSGATDVTVYNRGNVAVSQVAIAITAVSSAITALNVRDLAVPVDLFSFNGTIAAGKTAVFNFATKRFTNDGANAYAEFSRNGGNPFEEWINIAPGEDGQQFRITRTGGGAASTAAFNFYDGHA